MFTKESSSLFTKGKRVKDVPVRKSDRRQLLGLVEDVLYPKTGAPSEEDETKSNMLEACFLKGALMKRSIKLPSVMADLYLRSPRQDSDTADTTWPYELNTQCVWIQVDENRVVYNLPGVALLSVLPTTLLPTLVVPPQVSKFLCRGANLMRAGVRGIENASGQRPCLVAVEGNPHPFAVGLLHSDLCEDPIGTIGPGKQGTAAVIVHAYGDDIWRQQLPEKLCENDVDGGDYGIEGFIEGKLVHSVSTPDVAPNSVEEPIAGETLKDLAEPISVNPESIGEEPSPVTLPSGPAPDEVLHSAVCKALACLSVKKDLPMRMATFYANHVIQHRPEGTTIELKKTKYKKFGGYITEKAEEGLVTVGKDEQKDPLGMLVAFNRRHPDLEPFWDEATKIKDDSIASGPRKLVLTELYCIPNHFASMLRLDPDAVKGKNAASDVRKNKGMLTLKEVREILDEYISREELIKADTPDKIVLDGPLTDVLFKAKKGAASGPSPTEMTRKDVTTKWKSRLEPAYALVQMPGSAIVGMGRGKPPVVTIEVCRRQSNKFVTKVQGLEKFGIKPAAFSKDVAHRFACATSTDTTGGASVKEEVLVQGNLAGELEALLLGDSNITAHGGAKNSTYNLPKNAVELVLRKGVPARKRNKK